MENLNKIIVISNSCSDDNHKMQRNGGVFNPKDVELFFRDMKDNLISKIEKYEMVVGCVAWLTDPDILKALSKKSCQIVVQKEDFLRPDSVSNRKLHLLYSKLHLPLTVQCLSNYTLDYCGISYSDSVRCFGNYNEEKNPAFPRMHHKFIVLGSIIKDTDNYLKDYFVPKAVWTGSFNFTKNANSSLENAVFIEDEDIAKEYFKEYIQIFGMSEPLNWEHKWIAPEYRIGS